MVIRSAFSSTAPTSWACRRLASEKASTPEPVRTARTKKAITLANWSSARSVISSR